MEIIKEDEEEKNLKQEDVFKSILTFSKGTFEEKLNSFIKPDSIIMVKLKKEEEEIKG